MSDTYLERYQRELLAAARVIGGIAEEAAWSSGALVELLNHMHRNRPVEALTVGELLAVLRTRDAMFERASLATAPRRARRVRTASKEEAAA